MRARLTLLVAATATMILLAFALPMGILLRNSAAQHAIDAAEQEGQLLTPVIIGGDVGQVEAALQNVDSPYPVTVFWPDGTTSGAEAPRSPAVELAARGRSLTAATDGGREILFGVGLAEGTAVIRVLVTDRQLTDGVAESWLLLGAIAVALLGFGLLLATRFSRVLLIPLNDLSGVSHRLASGDLEARAKASGPEELREVGTALNTLADRIKDLLEAERERVADLSHRLRTPLTVLKLETEALGDHAQREAVEQAVAEVERAVNAAIQDARNPAEAGRCDAAAVVAERVEFWSALAEDTARECRVRLAPGPLPVQLSAADLAAAMDSLLANVFAHTPDGTAFEVRLTPRYEGGATVDVADEGPGLPNLGVFNRGRSEGGSTGLGLDIARRAAAASGGQLVFGQGPGGTGALIRLELG
ncbi:HAMP domain-containing histidine kinase [Glycomyces sp. TRM65418]|uniref:HAMP domain-containing sensor histidine kinase n=1 Tax=Glycomyces sp. TRM65418 TaxID=2867006 RepID=UPI001CE6F1B0|nr:HAMP domain-containing sensor histidine kinase [Glycomyces sp. TRM65418]MCC3764970.1 HAMP domain-containing histidine kinase [Glycomyces sp. TRM65418]QZD54606.1 HAMP domain-containing histidine kinase [Glycomyces sp. TRM65418]